MEYYQSRYSITKNKCLKAKYSDALYCLTRNKEWYKSTIDWHRSIIEENITNENGTYNIHIAVDRLIELSYNEKKTVLPGIIDFLITTIKKSGYEYQLFLIQVGHKDDLFKKSESKDIVDLCVKSARQITDYGFKRSFLNEGIYYAQKDTSLNTQKKQMFEMLGDNEAKNVIKVDDQVNNIAIPHLNQNTYKLMMDYYKKGCCQEKYNGAVRLYNENKQHLQFIRIPIKQEINSELSEMIEKHYKQINELKTPLFLWYLILGDSLVFLPNEKLMQLMQNNGNYFYKTMMRTVKIDLNGNEIPVDEKDEEIWEKFRIMELSMNSWKGFLYSNILASIETNKLSYAKTRQFLKKHTCFGSELIIKRSEVELVYDWFGQIDYAFQDFFKQMKLFVQGKKVDWRLSIDVLPAKFEGILRDMIGIHGGSITKLGKNGRTEDLLLDDLLKDKSFLEIFNEDDRNLFEYVFTNKGLNVRNNVAHGFYKPQDYTIDKAILVFLCIMRLAKFQQNDSTITCQE